jgi:DNA-binding XRE family transcriptional regulator/quercetin dioxygenase-like cupin family protein
MTGVDGRSGRAVRIEEHVDGIVSSIGPKLKKLRQEQRLSLQQLAVKAEVSAAAIHKIERNDMVPTITTLLKIATALERPVSYFVDNDTAPEPVAFIRSSERPAVFTPHAGLSLAGVSGPYAPFRSAAAVATVEPGAQSGSKALIHAGEELVYVLEGSMVFKIAGTRYKVGRGDALHFIGDQPHHWANEAKTRARALWVALRDS